LNLKTAASIGLRACPGYGAYTDCSNSDHCRDISFILPGLRHMVPPPNFPADATRMISAYTIHCS
jgi:hypothetical protein